MEDESKASDQQRDGSVEIRGAQSVPDTGDSAPEAESKQIAIDYQVELVPQPTEASCWAAALAMITSFRDQASYSADEVASRANMDIKRSYGWNDIRSAVSTWQLKEAGPTCAMPGYWAGLLQANGPLWVVEVGNPGTHAVVLVGMHGDGTPEGTSATLNNPWPPNQGAVQEKTFQDFDKDFGLGAKASAMIVHP
jgi:hypothetical protein